MGIYSEYLNKNLNFNQLTTERKRQLKEISKLRGGRDIIVYASDVNNKNNAPIAFDFSDILPFQDQLSNLNGKAIDVILETNGGIAEAVEDIVRLIRGRYEHVGIIIPGTAKSAGTIFAMAGDEILMGESSSLGPIDAQIISLNKRFSADAFLEGLKKIKEDVVTSGKLNPAYIPILQNISPGEIQHCENAQDFSKKLVREWLSQYKFKFWDKHSSTGQKVTQAEKEKRAEDIAEKLCKHSDWLTHSRSIKITDLESMGLQIIDYAKNRDLNDAITRYYTLLRMSFEGINIYKIMETCESQILKFHIQNGLPQPPQPTQQKVDNALFDVECSKCHRKTKIQAKLDKNAKAEPNAIPYPKNDIFVCRYCGNQNNVSQARLQIESQTGKKIVF
ncbi:MAG: SDH family Clp fold serine proteinase [Ginsengibacter sp.]